MLRDTEGEVAAPCYFCCCRYFLTPPSLRVTSPIFLRSKNTEEEGESNPLFIAVKCTYIALSHPVMPRDTAGRSVRVPLYYYTDSHLPVSSGVKPLWWA